ncbi:ribonuclease HI [Devosia sp. YR412]|uniref:ribonuclease HI n=1 Tax=Devosia sp. YR412 TaxID=1881030 RepID=UPI0008C4EAED|nr:ribonuclease HI [Devosia sp. YR412]SEQ52056.1 ribonuclease HI [Devosia sp. YR412]
MTDIIDISPAPTNIAPTRRYVVATDGACRSNPGPGGWGAVLTSFDGDTVRDTKTLSGAKRHATNNEMELTAAIKALSWLPANDVPALVRSDSQYVINGMNEWRHGWVANNWRTSAGKPVKNRELWEALIAAMGDREVVWEWVRGHSGHQDNEAADQLANNAIERMLTRKRA